MRSFINKTRKKALNELHKSFHEDKTPKEIARSFSIGVFITSLPTLGLGLLLFVVLDKMFDWISRLALLASVVVLNPFIKPLVWLASINLGAIILTRNFTVTTNPESAITYLIVGNLVIAFIFSIIAYLFALEAVRKYREENLHVLDELDDIVEKEMEELEES